MSKNLTKDCLANFQNTEVCFSAKRIELQNNVEVLGIKANRLQIENDEIAVGYIVDEIIYFKSLKQGSTVVTLTDGEHEARITLFVHSLGDIVAEVTPFLKYAEVVPVYYRNLLNHTAIAVDLKGALKDYLISQRLMHEDDVLADVHYQSMHPNVLNHSIAGNFILGCHMNGVPLTNKQEYALANRIATLKFSKINFYQQGVKVTLIQQMILTFVITNQVFLSDDERRLQAKIVKPSPVLI
ncbi:hypothetical protein [Lysinibacillus sp. LZ02]|uniref:hypothetical protein n=1 Tax=Lysinibacillus sp. LZ02 TaxID=3420668 RepID=UPI003D364665